VVEDEQTLFRALVTVEAVGGELLARRPVERCHHRYIGGVVLEINVWLISEGTRPTSWLLALSLKSFQKLLAFPSKSPIIRGSSGVCWGSA
jgi:hypothetical protein